MYRQKIVTEIIETLKTIKQDNGFYTNAGNKVFEWMEKSLEDKDFPCLVVRDPSSKAKDEGIIEHRLKIDIDIATKGKNSIWTMREVLADTLKSFKALEESLCLEIHYLGFESLIEQRESMYSGTRVEFEIIYRTARFEI